MNFIEFIQFVPPGWLIFAEKLMNFWLQTLDKPLMTYLDKTTFGNKRLKILISIDTV